MTRPVLLDLFCGAGGCAVGYHRAGFDVVGVDIAPQPRYPFLFVQGDALDVGARLLADEAFAAVHASPPCQAYSRATAYHGTHADHPEMVDTTRDLLDASGLPYVIENVDGAPVRRDLVLCGEMFGLGVHRHRVFECGGGFVPMRFPHARHRLRGGAHNCDLRDGHARVVAGNMADPAGARVAMGVDWPMTRRELAQSIPPAYTEWIGEQLVRLVRAAA